MIATCEPVVVTSIPLALTDSRQINVLIFVTLNGLCRKGALLKSLKIQLPVPLFLVVLHHQQISFERDYLKKIFITIVPFLTDSSETPSNLLNGQNLLSVTKVLCRCSLTDIIYTCNALSSA